MLVAGALGGVDVVGVAAADRDDLRQHAPERPVPLDRVVAARLPGWISTGSPRPRGSRSSSRKRCQAWNGAEQAARAALVRMALEQQPHAGGRQRRLRDAGDAPAVGARAPPPPARPRQVAPAEPREAAPPEGDVGDHPLRVARPGERLELGPGAAGVELGPAERRSARVPVPLVRVGGARRQRVAPAVVRAQNLLGGPPSGSPPNTATSARLCVGVCMKRTIITIAAVASGGRARRRWSAQQAPDHAQHRREP